LSTCSIYAPNIGFVYLEAYLIATRNPPYERITFAKIMLIFLKSFIIFLKIVDRGAWGALSLMSGIRRRVICC